MKYLYSILLYIYMLSPFLAELGALSASSLVGLPSVGDMLNEDGTPKDVLHTPYTSQCYMQDCRKKGIESFKTFFL